MQDGGWPMKDDRALDQLLKKMAADHRPQLPSPGLIWWRAQLQRKQKEKQRIERPLVIMQQIAVVVCGAVFVALLVDNLGRFQTMIRNTSWFFVPLVALTATVAVVTVWRFWPRMKR